MFYLPFVAVSEAGVNGAIRSNNLQVLRLGGNALTDIPSFGALPSLKTLDLSYTGLTNFHFLHGN